MPNVKKPRRDVPTDTAPARPRVTLTHLPIEILAEILLTTCSPPTVLAVSRTCSFLHRTLVQNPNASFIWRGVRQTCAPSPLPDPGDLWKKSEYDYAAFVFSGGVCEVCGEATRAMYASFAARIRLCGNWHCRRKFLNESVFVATVTQGDAYRSLWIPYAESDICFYPSKTNFVLWPRMGSARMRRTDWEKYLRDLKAFRDAEQAQTERARDVEPAFLPATGEEEEPILKQCRTAMARFPQIMELSTRLIQWKLEYELQSKFVRKMNDLWTKSLATREGWNIENLVATETYGTLQRRMNSFLEQIDNKDVSPIRSRIESELLALQARHKRQDAEKAYKERLTEVKKIYERMRCGTLEGTGTSGSEEPIILPPLSVFCTLPFVRVFKGSPDPNTLTPVTNEVKSSFAISLIMADLQTWRIPVEKYLMTLLGYPNGWQSASTHALTPLKRITARFFCRECGEGKVGRRYQRELCLDYRGVCLHVCVAKPRAGGGETRGDKGKKEWRVDMFEKDDKAISIIRTILGLLGISEELPMAALSLTMGGGIRCKTCKGWIVMDIETAIGHAHRHKRMEIELFPRLVSDLVPLKRAYERPVARSHLGFERGKCETLMRRCHAATNLRKKVEYGCRHCLIVAEDDVFVDAGKVRAMSFDGLRSHIKEKHGIQDIRDEDMFSYTRIG